MYLVIAMLFFVTPRPRPLPFASVSWSCLLLVLSGGSSSLASLTFQTDPAEVGSTGAEARVLHPDYLLSAPWFLNSDVTYAFLP
jgi:hypothetical protein